MAYEKFFGTDSNLEPRKADITPVTEVGGRGQAVYTVKTAYTDIVIDGKKDPVYDYGIHLSGLIVPAEYREYYKDRPTNVEVYMVRGQDGRLYIFGHCRRNRFSRGGSCDCHVCSSDDFDFQHCNYSTG